MLLCGTYVWVWYCVVHACVVLCGACVWYMCVELCGTRVCGTVWCMCVVLCGTVWYPHSSGNADGDDESGDDEDDM